MSRSHYKIPVIFPEKKAITAQHATLYRISGRKIRAATPGKYEEDKNFPLYDIQDIEDVYPGITEKVKRGDIFEDVDGSGYRSMGVFFFDGHKTIRQGHYYDDYGYPPDEFKLIIEFPPGYWDVQNLIVNDDYEKPSRVNRVAVGSMILDTPFYWHLPNPPSFLYLDELDVPREVEISEVSVPCGKEYSFKLKYFIWDYNGSRYLIDEGILNYAKEEEKEVKKITGHYGYWAVKKDKDMLNLIREEIKDPSVNYVFFLHC